MAGKSKAAVETAAGAKKGRVMYVGPTAPGIGIQNCVYTEIPASAQDVIKAEPQIGNLFVKVRDYPAANRMLREKKGYIYNAFLRAESIMAENAGKGLDRSSGVEEERR